jgi:hypothetical protein
MHAGGMGRRRSQDIHDWAWQRARFSHLLLDIIKLLARGKLAKPEEISCFLKRCPARQFMDIIAADD